MRTQILRLLGLVTLALVLSTSSPANALPPLVATGQNNSADITIVVVGDVSGIDATKINVYPLLVVRTPPFYPTPGLSEGCGTRTDPNIGTGSANSGTAFGTRSFNGVTTTITVTLQNVMATGLWAVDVGSGALSPDSSGCARFHAA